MLKGMREFYVFREMSPIQRAETIKTISAREMIFGV